MGSIPASGRCPGEGNGNPFQYFLPGKFHEQRSLAGYTPRARKESDMTEETRTNAPAYPDPLYILSHKSYVYMLSYTHHIHTSHNDVLINGWILPVHLITNKCLWERPMNPLFPLLLPQICFLQALTPCCTCGHYVFLVNVCLPYQTVSSIRPGLNWFIHL